MNNGRVWRREEPGWSFPEGWEGSRIALVAIGEEDLSNVRDGDYVVALVKWSSSAEAVVGKARRTKMGRLVIDPERSDGTLLLDCDDPDVRITGRVCEIRRTLVDEVASPQQLRVRPRLQDQVGPRAPQAVPALRQDRL